MMVGAGVMEEGGEEIRSAQEGEGMLTRLIKSAKREGKIEGKIEDIINILKKFKEVP